MKGVELPINVLVIVVLGLIVLLAMLALWFGVWPSVPEGVGLETAKNTACQMFFSTGCEDPEYVLVNNFDADKDGEHDPGTNADEGCPNAGSGDNLMKLCECWYGVAPQDELDCAERICNCR